MLVGPEAGSDAVSPEGLESLIHSYKSDPESVYNTWFVTDQDRLKAFRSIRRGVREIVDAVVGGRFGNDFKGSPLEVVLTAITEQKQVFEGAAHPFYWKPKLRIPDIYENVENKRRFAQCLDACLNATREDQVLAEVSRLADARIKGLGPSVANILYFLHPTIIPPFNTAIVNGFNALFGAKKKLGSWESFLEMRESIVRTNELVRGLLSKDLGAFAGLLYEIGTGRLIVGGNSEVVLAQENVRAERSARARHSSVVAEQQEQSEHTRIQHMLIRIGRALGYEVHVARNDRHRACAGESFSLMTVATLPASGWPPEVLDTISLIDVIWLMKGTGSVVSAFEVEKSTSIYSGILRLQDLARTIPAPGCPLYLVAPDERQSQVMAQLVRPAFRDDPTGESMAYIPFSALCEHCNAMCKFGADHTVLQKIARHRPVQ